MSTLDPHQLWQEHLEEYDSSRADLPPNDSVVHDGVSDYRARHPELPPTASVATVKALLALEQQCPASLRSRLAACFAPPIEEANP